MSNQVATTDQHALESLVLHGDLGKMTDKQKVGYYLDLCRSLGLSAHSQPFRILKFQGREVMYATKDCTEQLRKIHEISVVDLIIDLQPDSTYSVTCKVKDKNGKTDMSTGVVSIENLKGEALANAKMKAETKAKRRATLSICGLGMMDESEIETVEGAVVVDIPKEQAKRPVSDKAFQDAMDRISGGDRGIIGKLRDTFILSPAQAEALIAAEDANHIPVA